MKEDELKELDRYKETANKQKKLGILNFVLLLMIISYFISSLTSFFITDANLITEDKYKSNSLCCFQGLLKVFFDILSLGLTTVLSLTMRNSFKFILIKKLANKTVYYILYFVIFTFILSFG